MGRKFFNSYVCIILAAIGELVLGEETCLIMEFPNISENTVRSKENSNVSIHFYLNKSKCKVIPDYVYIDVIKEKNGGLGKECTISLEAGTCVLVDSSPSCQCTSTDNMLFLKRVTKSDKGVYVWIWGALEGPEKKRRITLLVSDADSEFVTQGTDTHESTTTFIQKAADPGTRAVKSVGPNIDNGITLIVTVAVCVCLVVMTAVVTAGIVCCVKARRRQDQLRIRPDFAFTNLNGALHELNISRDQARDIYEEIPDPPKAHRVSRVNSTSSSKSGVKLPPIPDMEQHEGTATLSPLKQAESCDFDGYLHPADICDQLP